MKKSLKEYLKIILLLTLVTDVNSIECYDCSGSHTYCNNTRTTKTCTGPQYSCLLSQDTTKVRVIENGALDYKLLTTVTKSCGVEIRSYCKEKQDMDPNIILCQTEWCYKDFCNFDLKKRDTGAKTQNNQVDPYGWYKPSSATRIKSAGLFPLCLLPVISILPNY